MYIIVLFTNHCVNTNNDKIPIKVIVPYQNFKYDNIRKVHGGSNAYVLLIIHCTIHFIFHCTYRLFKMETDFIFHHYCSIDSI